jgi:hypothetical protein
MKELRKLYREWLSLLCEWAIGGLDGEGYKRFDELTSKLDKHCQDCEEGYICFRCKDSGLSLSFEELNIYNSVEKALDKNRDNVLS